MTRPRGRPAGAASLAAALLALQPASAQEPGEAGEAQQPIVVTGIRIQDYRDRLAACLERNCPTDEDADATLALAEVLFLNGDYAEARRAVAASLARNRRRAADFPEPVSDLFRAHARISRHMGQDWAGLRSTHGILSALRQGIPEEDHRHFTARLELSELYMMMGRAPAARRELDRLTDIARASGREDVATVAELRRLWFDYMADRHGPALARLVEMSERTAPTERMRRTGARILLARIYRGEGRTDRADALLAEIGRGTPARRRLLHAPVYTLQGQDDGSGSDVQTVDAIAHGVERHSLAPDIRDTWIDVGFWVLPDGRVSGLEILRQGARADWAEPLLRSIRGRLYSTAGEATYRLERYTYTAPLTSGTASRIRTRSARRLRVEYLDLTLDGAPPPAETSPLDPPPQDD